MNKEVIAGTVFIRLGTDIGLAFREEGLRVTIWSNGNETIEDFTFAEVFQNSLNGMSEGAQGAIRDRLVKDLRQFANQIKRRKPANAKSR